MSELNTSRHCWSWRSCFATVKYNKKRSKKQANHQSNLQKFSNGHTCNNNNNKRLQTADEKSNILADFDLIPTSPMTNGDSVSREILSNEHENDNFINNNYSILQTVDSINSKIISQKSSATARSTQLDAIVEDSSEENIDELDESIPLVRLCNDRELINDSNVLYSRLSDLSKMNHIMIQFNDKGYFLGEFTHQLSKLKLKIDDITRTSAEIPRDAELLEAKYSTLLATIECLSLLLKVTQISSSRSFINHLLCSIEQRMGQLNKLVQLSSSISTYQQQDQIDDDLLSFRSALSSYEHLLTIS